MIEETIQWQNAALALPDSDMTCLIFNDQWSDPVREGYLDGDLWRCLDATPLHFETDEESDPELAAPTHWADMPKGPTP